MNDISSTVLATFSLAATVTAATFQVGAGLTYQSPKVVAALVSDGDTVEIASGIYANEEATWNRNNLVIRGKTAFAHMVAPATIQNGKAIWVITGNDVVVENIEFSGASVVDQNGAGIRAEGTNLTVRKSYFHDNENGILGGKGHVKIEQSEFFDNGFGDGYSHNIYIANCDTLSVSFSYFHHAKIGHELKSRAKVNIIQYSKFMNGVDGTASYEIDLPNGGESYLIGNVIQQGSATDNPTMVTYGEEGLSNPSSTIYFINNTLVNDRSSGTFLRLSTGSTARVQNNLYLGAGTWLSGVEDTASNIAGISSDVVSLSGYDYHLSSTSRARDAGIDPGNAGAMALLPTWEFGAGQERIVRLDDGNLDVGAFEFGSSSTPLLPSVRPPRKQLPKQLWFAPHPIPASGIGVDGARRQMSAMPFLPVE